MRIGAEMDHITCSVKKIDIEIGWVVRGGEIKVQLLAARIAEDTGLGVGTQKQRIGDLIGALGQANRGNSAQRATLRTWQQPHLVGEHNIAAHLCLQGRQYRLSQPVFWQVPPQFQSCGFGIKDHLQPRTGNRAEQPGKTVAQVCRLTAGIAGSGEALKRGD
jgi:hypothetical protein